MIKSARANEAVEYTLCHIRKMRDADDNRLDRLVFCFPRVRAVGEDEYTDGSVFAVAAAAVARNSDNRVDKTTRVKEYDKGHSIPSRFVPLKGIDDVEYHVSRQNLERLLRVDCIVFQRYRKGFGMRIPYTSPAYSSKPAK